VSSQDGTVDFEESGTWALAVWESEGDELTSTSTLNEVHKYDGNFNLYWYYMVPSADDTVWVYIGSTSHTVYLVLDTPQAPMGKPWQKVLNLACDDNWAGGVSDFGGVLTGVGQAIYESKSPLPNNINYNGTKPWYSYKDDNTEPFDLGDGWYFHLGSFLSDIESDNRDFSCCCVANFYQICVAAVGATAQWKALDVDPQAADFEDYMKGGTPNPWRFTTNPVDPIGAPGVGARQWNFHQVLLSGGEIYDACVKIGGNWQLGLAEATYRTNLGPYVVASTKTGTTTLK